MKKILLWVGVLTLGLGLLITGCAQPSTPTQTISASPTPSATPAKPFEGVNITVAVGSFMAPGVKMFVPEWEAKTGGKITVVEIPFGDLYSKLLTSFSSGAGTYDVAIYAANWIPDFAEAGYIMSLEKYYPQKDNWNDVLPVMQKAMYVKGQRYSIPMDGDIIFGYYRKDALENPEYQTKFKEKYGYDLAPPKTWEEYHDIAEFFTGWDWDKDGKPDWGCLEALGPHDVGPYIFLTRAAAYSAYPGKPGSFFFDPDTMKAQAANPGFVKALQDWIDIKKFGPPEMVTYGGGDMRGNFVAGNFALGIDWADVGIMSQDPEKSTIKGKIGYFLAPGSNDVYNYTTGQWDHFDGVQYAPYLGWGGWHASIASTCKHPDAAWDFINFIDTTENAFKAVTTPGTARNPYRYSQFVPDRWKTSAVKYDDSVDQYLEVQKEGMTHPNAQYDLRIPKAGRYIDALDKYLSQAIAGQMSPEDALKAAAQEWDKITQEVGLDSQKAVYRSNYGLAP